MELSEAMQCPELALIHAVLAQAVSDCQRPKPTLTQANGKRRSRKDWAKRKEAWLREREQALSWLLARPVDDPPLMSAQWCCVQIGWRYSECREVWARTFLGYYEAE